MDPKIMKTGTLKSLNFTPEAYRRTSETSDDGKMKPREINSLPKWSHRAVLVPCGRFKSSIFEHLQPPECVSEQHFAVKCSSKKSARVPSMQNVRFSWFVAEQYQTIKMWSQKTASILSLQTSCSSHDVAAEYLKADMWQKKMARVPLRFREYRLYQIAKSVTP